MKVIAKPFASSAAGWLDEGEILTVLAVTVMPLEGVKFLIWSTQQEAATLFPGADFDVVDKYLSKRWVFGLDSQGDVYLAPDVWQVDGIWERYHDGESVVEQVFMNEMEFILSE